ncbi:MAG TPA: hypothetical protein VLR89_04250 [Anaerolineaceae bacterium]|nr:hypothetical protein [Anaerolineaceae bacterium]
MSRVELSAKAPEIDLMTADGRPFRLSEQLGRNVLVVLHRGFT